MALGDQLPGPVLRHLVELAVADEIDELGKRREEIRVAATYRDPLRRQGVAADLPPPVDIAEHVLVGHEHVVDVDGVEKLLARQLTQRLDRDAFALHVQQEVADAIMFWGAWLSSRQQRAPLRILRGGGPDLLAGDAPT